jgi:hypothetical protein
LELGRWQDAVISFLSDITRDVNCDINQRRSVANFAASSHHFAIESISNGFGAKWQISLFPLQP